MNWASWHEFWSMGGDGLYVWSAYLVAGAVIVTEIIVLAISRRSILEHLGRYARMRQRPHQRDRQAAHGASNDAPPSPSDESPPGAH